MRSDKTKVIMDYNKLSHEIKEKIQHTYPAGISALMVNYRNSEGKNVLALRFETDEMIYLIRMSEKMAMNLIDIDSDDDDFSQTLNVDLMNEDIGTDIDNLLDFFT